MPCAEQDGSIVIRKSHPDTPGRFALGRSPLYFWPGSVGRSDSPSGRRTPCHRMRRAQGVADVAPVGVGKGKLYAREKAREEHGVAARPGQVDAIADVEQVGPGPHSESISEPRKFGGRSITIAEGRAPASSAWRRRCRGSCLAPGRRTWPVLARIGPYSARSIPEGRTPFCTMLVPGRRRQENLGLQVCLPELPTRGKVRH